MALIREDRLKSVNHAVMKDIIDLYTTEQEATLMTTVNLCAHLLEYQKKVRHDHQGHRVLGGRLENNCNCLVFNIFKHFN